jgi:hypothetical protein
MLKTEMSSIINSYNASTLADTTEPPQTELAHTSGLHVLFEDCDSHSPCSSHPTMVPEIV